MIEDLPKNWEVIKLNDVLYYEQPTNYIVESTKYSNSYQTPVLTAGKTFILGYTNEKNGVYDKLPCIIFDDFTTESKYVDFSFKVKSSAMKILTNNKYTNLKFLYYSMQTIECIADTHKRFWISDYSNKPIYLPPLAEQQRIVEKIEKLFAQVDKIEEEKQSLLKLIDRAKEKVLDLAMKGKLVKQDTNDEPASVLLEKIFEEKKKLAKEGKIKLSKDELLPPQISDDNDYYQDLPENWALTKLKHIGIWGAGSTPIRKIKEYYNGNIPWLKTGELNNNIIFDSEEKITEKALKECNLKQNKIGNVLIAMYGATIGKLGIAGIELTTNQACCGCQPFIFNKYLFYFLMSIKNDLISQGSGGAQPNISKNIIVNNFIALPPLIEQKKIVSTLEILLNSLDQIKDSL